MSARIETRADGSTRSPRPTATVVYTMLAVLAALTSAGIWLLMVVDERRAAGAATVQMFVTFTNLTVLLVGAVAAWIAVSDRRLPLRGVAHLTVTVMAVVTAIVNATLLDAALPSGWWGVVDLSQHYVIPVAVVASWATLGPPFAVPRPRLWSLLVVPFAWLLVVLTRGAITESYPYDFLDPARNGWATVLATVAAILLLMLVTGLGLTTLERRRRGRHEADRRTRGGHRPSRPASPRPTR